MSNDMIPVRRDTIGRRLSWQVALLSLIALMALPGVAVLGWQVTMREVQAYLQMPRDKVAEAFTVFLGRAVNDLWATSDALGAYGDADRLFQRMLARQEAGFVDLLWVRADGKVMASRSRSGISQGGQTLDQPWLETVKAGNFYIGAPDYTEEAISLVMAAPVRDDAQAFKSTLVARVDLTPLLSMMTSLAGGEADYVVYVTDADGRVLLHQDKQWMQQRSVILSPITLQEFSEATTPVYTSVATQPVMAVGIALRVVPWHIVVQQPVLAAISPFLLQIAFLLLLLGGIIFLIVNTLLFTRREIVMPLRVLHSGVFTLEHDLAYRIETTARGEFATLAATLNSLAAQLDQTIRTLERRVDERTRGLLTAAEVSRSTTSVLDPEALLQQIVHLVRDRFALYYVGLFLLDESEKHLVLRAGTGESGRQMLAAGFHFPLDADALVARCITTARAHIGLDVGEEAQNFDNPLLPRTRSEMALPLRSQQRVIGALTVQSEREAAFDETNILVMQTVADQAAVAIDNARLYARAQEALHEMESLQQRYVGEAWTEFLHRRPLWGYRKTREELSPLGQEPLAGVLQAMAQRQTLITEPGETSGGVPRVVVPLRFRDQLLGALGFAAAEGEMLSDEQIAFVEAVAEQFGLAAENLRLVDATQRLAAREHMVGEVSARIRESLDLDTVLRTAAEQIRLAMQTPEVTIRLRMAEVDHEKRA